VSLAEKYDTENKWRETCGVCGVDVEMDNARSEVLGPYCEGCFGWPVCACKTPHTGQCPSAGGVT